MGKFRPAFIAAAALMVFGSIAANAGPTAPPTAFVPQSVLGGPFIDNMFVFQVVQGGANLIEGLAATSTDIAGCGAPLINGCFFTVPNPPGIPMNAALEDRYTLVYRPDGVTLSAIFGMNCNGVGCNLAFLAPVPGQNFDLTGVPIDDFFFVTEIAGAKATMFDATYYLDPTFSRTHPGFLARFVSTAVPEPATLTLFGAGMLGAAAMRRRKKRS